MGPVERIAEDMAALSRVERRFAGSEGEREMLHAVARQLPKGVVGRTEGFVAHTTPTLVHVLHDVALLVAGAVGLAVPAVGLILAALATASYVLDATGRTSLFRWVLPMSPSYNFVVRATPASDAGKPLGTLVLSAPLDAPRWAFADWWFLRHSRPQRVTLGAGLVITGMLLLRTLAEPWGPRTLEIYVGALIVMAFAMAIGILLHRRPGTGRDDAGGAAVLLELVHRLDRRPLQGVDVWFAFTGCSHAYHSGMNAFLTLHEKTVADPTFVVAIEDPARLPLLAVESEGLLWPNHHRPTGPALLERLRWAGVVVPPIDLAGSTDAFPAWQHGYRAVALKGGSGRPTAEAASRAADVVETVARWYADDLARLAVDRSALETLARQPSEVTATPEPAKVADP